MRLLRIHLSEAAVNDILEQSEWYEEQSGVQLAARWESAVTSALSGICRHPQSGTVCTFKHLELKDVRRISISTFPKHLIFYRIESDAIFVLRIVHGARDLEALF